jgi:hypothetical protein
VFKEIHVCFEISHKPTGGFEDNDLLEHLESACELVVNNIFLFHIILSIPGFNVTPIHTVTNDIVFFSDHIP